MQEQQPTIGGRDLKSSGAVYNQINNRQLMSGPPPYNPFMFPFPYHYPPPPFPAHHLPQHPKGSPQQEHYPPNMHLSHFPFSPFPMMYPPPFHDPYFRMLDFKGFPKSAQAGTQQRGQRENRENKGDSINKPTVIPSKNPTNVIVLSDDEDQLTPSKTNPKSSRKELQTKTSHPRQSNNQIKLRRTERKQPPPNRIDQLPPKTKPIEKKEKTVKPHKEKQEVKLPQIKELKPIPQPPIVETNSQLLSRSTRIKFLSVKDGKGKIMLGEEFQAVVPTFSFKDENFTIWLTFKRKDLLSRFRNKGI